MRNVLSVILISVFAFLLTACSGQNEGELTRVDVQIIDAKGEYKEDVTIITNNEIIELLNQTFQLIKWENKVSDMVRKPNAKLTFFYTFDENMPERLVDYEIWFDEKNNTTTIINYDKDKTYGKLNKEDARKLKQILLN